MIFQRPPKQAILDQVYKNRRQCMREGNVSVHKLCNVKKDSLSVPSDPVIVYFSVTTTTLLDYSGLRIKASRQLTFCSLKTW